MIRSFCLLVAVVSAAWSQCWTKQGCTERFPYGPVGRFTLIYRSFALDRPRAEIRRAVIVIHGAGRNADDYFVSAMAGAMLAGRLEDTLVIAPRLASRHGRCKDPMAEGEISWTCGGPQDWRRGGQAAEEKTLTSFGLIDEMIRALARKDRFPNLELIIVSGHSAGGQFVHRYAAANQVDGKLAVRMRYVVANPSSYLYLDDTRLPFGASCTAEGKCTENFVRYPDAENCTSYNRWHYGLEQKSGYAASVSDENLRRQLLSREVVYLLGDLDTLPLAGFDASCPAMAQGPHRLARGLNYWSYVKAKFNAGHKLVIVPFCGHNGRCMYTADVALPVLFGD